MSADTSQGTTKTIIEVTHDRLIDAGDVIQYLLRNVRADRTNGLGHNGHVAKCIDHARDVTPTPVVSEYRIRIAHDPEDTPGDVRQKVEAALLGAEVACVVCEHTNGGCCEFGPDKAAA
jgi:hypothetical protein